MGKIKTFLEAEKILLKAILELDAFSEIRMLFSSLPKPLYLAANPLQLLYILVTRNKEKANN